MTPDNHVTMINNMNITTPGREVTPDMTNLSDKVL